MNKDTNYLNERSRKKAEQSGEKEEEVPQPQPNMNVVINNNVGSSIGKHVVQLRSQMLNNNKSGGIVSMSGIRDNATTELDVNSNEVTSD